ncbi:MAG TPA: hypothetical protein VI299_22295 [Polyangiales bacterium]
MKREYREMMSRLHDGPRIALLKTLAQDAYGESSCEIVLSLHWARVMSAGRVLCEITSHEGDALDALERYLRTLFPQLAEP